MKKIFIQWSRPITAVLIVLAVIGYYLGSKLELRLSLTDLLPKNHPAVVKLEKLTEVVGGVGYFAIVLHAEDGKSHLAAAPAITKALQENPEVRNAFYHREKKFFTERLLYYMDLDQLRDLDKNIRREILLARQRIFDLGLFRDEKPAADTKTLLDDEFKKQAKSSAEISPFLISKDSKNLLVMVKPKFDSMDLERTKALTTFSEKLLKDTLPANVTYDFAERYYNKVIETEMIQHDIFVLGTLSIVCIALIIFLYIRSIRGLIVIFAPVFIGMGITFGITRLAIGHINIITGFLMGIVSGLGVDYGIHVLLRLHMEKAEPSSKDSDPVWRTLTSSGHSVFVGAAAASMAFFLLCFSSFRAFSEFGFICGVGIIAVLVCLLASFSTFVRVLKVDTAPERKKKSKSVLAKYMVLPILPVPKGLIVGGVITVLICAVGAKVGFEYDFEKMLQHSKKLTELSDLVDEIYERSSAPSAISVPTKEEAKAVEKVIKEKYMPHLVSEMISGASIIPDDQAEKQIVLQSIHEKIRPLKDRWIKAALDVPADVVRQWTEAKPFTFNDIPAHLQDALRGTRQEGFLFYLYPAIKLNDAHAVRTFAAMVNDIDRSFPSVLTGSDAVVFSDILDLINHDGALILIVIFLSVGLFIWANVRKIDETLLSYIPLILSLPVGMGLMVLFGVKFNIFNIAIIPTFVAMGIDVPIHIVHRAKEVGSGFKAARDLASSINLALLTAAMGFGVLIFAQAGVLRSLGWIALLGTVAIWWIGLFILPAFLELYWKAKNRAGKKTKNRTGHGVVDPA